MPRILIIGRGVLPLLGALLAEKQGYETSVIFEDAPVSPASFLGGLPGLPLSSFFDTVGFPMQDPRFFRTISPSILFLGKKWQLAGMPELRSGFSVLERSRWMPQFDRIQETLFPRLFDGMKNEMVRFFRRKGLSGFLETWWNGYLFRRQDRLLKQYLSIFPDELMEWKDFLDTLGFFLGLSPEEKNPVYKVRALTCLLTTWTCYPEIDPLFREAQKSVQRQSPISAIAWDGKPLLLLQDRKKRKISLTSEKGEDVFDRVLDLSGDLEEKRDLQRWEWTVPSKEIPDAWPLQCLLPHGKDQPAILLQGRQREEKISFSVLACGPGTPAGASVVCSRLSEKLFAFREDSCRLVAQEEPAPMVQIEEAKPSHWRKRSPYLHTRGTLFRMMDPTRIPFLTDDWVRQLFYTLMQR